MELLRELQLILLIVSCVERGIPVFTRIFSLLQPDKCNIRNSKASSKPVKSFPLWVFSTGPHQPADMLFLSTLLWPAPL
jgi:hypothetical protein